jgi:hypothetical protein
MRQHVLNQRREPFGMEAGTMQMALRRHATIRPHGGAARVGGSFEGEEQHGLAMDGFVNRRRKAVVVRSQTYPEPEIGRIR